ncbi:MAG: hypothetical protein Q7S33_04080 [Nanoarchaeota archaeon]|nr:hypothetical protein [Nanoarchaeota archaeon]
MIKGAERVRFLVIFFIVSIFMIILISAVPTWIISGTNSSSYEDQIPIFSYNLTSNASDAENASYVFQTNPPGNYPILSSLYGQKNLSFYSWITLNASTGILTINSTRDNETGNFNMSIDVVAPDSQSAGSRWFYFNVTAINDAPTFSNVANYTVNVSQPFSTLIYIADEEDNVPFDLNISFNECNTAQWSPRNNTDCILFTSSNYNFNSTTGVLNISFTPSRNDVGNYTVNFTVRDSGITTNPNNANTTLLLNFTITNINLEPYFYYSCNNERLWNESDNILCWINASDIDEINNLTFISNATLSPSYSISNSSFFLGLTSVPVNVSYDFNGSILINFTATNLNVGNWSINISVNDTGSPIKMNSTSFWFFINNTEDPVVLSSIENKTIYFNNSNDANTTFYINASDNDLFIPDKTLKNENLTFRSNESWANISYYAAVYLLSRNYTIAQVVIDTSSAFTLYGNSNLTVNISVNDTFGNIDSQLVVIQILGNNLVAWDANTTTTFLIYENNLTYFNLSQNVSDADLDTITFSFTNDTAFPGFSLNSTTGEINFTPTNLDVGAHIVTITATDSKQNSLKTFIFNITNINDLPNIYDLTTNVNSSYSAPNFTTSERNYTTINLHISDNDFLIPANQKIYYNESLNVTTTITNSSGGISPLFNFSFYGLTNTTSVYQVLFTPIKVDVGRYNVSVDVIDRNNVTDQFNFTLIIVAINNAPEIMVVTNQTWNVNKTTQFYYRINATDVEDGNSTTLGNTNLTFNITFLSGISFINSTNFNVTSGELNLTFSENQAGAYHLNVSVNDSLDKVSSKEFWIYVYDTPVIMFPALSYQSFLAENLSYNLTFRANHSVADNLTFKIYISNYTHTDILKYNLNYYGNNTNLNWSFSPNFTDETYGIRNLTLVVLNPIYPELNTSYIWNITINHTNFPVNFSGTIASRTAPYGTGISINLRNYFRDLDNLDGYYNETVNFTIRSNATTSAITKSVSSDWLLTLSATTNTIEILNISASDLNNVTNLSMTNATSNSFEVTFTTPAPAPVATPATGGGGGGVSAVKYISIKLIVPQDIILSGSDTIKIPFEVQNNGQMSLNKIFLSSKVLFNNVESEDVQISLPEGYIEQLDFGQSRKLVMNIKGDLTKSGKYKATIYANVTSPKFFDYGDFYIELTKSNETNAEKELVFSEKLVAENPECLELTELVNEARNFFNKGDVENSLKKSQEAIKACESSISKNEQVTYATNFVKDKFFYVLTTTLAVFGLGFVFYFYKRVRFNKLRRNEYIGE